MKSTHFYGSINSSEIILQTEYKSIASTEPVSGDIIIDEKTSLLIKFKSEKKVYFSPRKLILFPLIWLQNLFLKCGIFGSFTRNDICNRKVSFLIGASSCIIVVWLTVLCLTALDQLSLVFLQLSESHQGQYDLQIIASNVPGISLNYYKIEDALLNKGVNASAFKNIPFEHSFAPRIFASLLGIVPTKQCHISNFDFSNTSAATHEKWNQWMYCKSEFNYPFCVPKFCSPPQGGASFFIFDTPKEQSMGLGRSWPLNDPIPKGMVVISQALALELNITEGDSILIAVRTDLLVGAYREAQIITDDHYKAPIINYMPVTVYKILDQPYGKFAWSTNYFIVMEYAPFLSHFAYFLPPTVATEEQKILLSTVDAYQYASAIYLNHPHRFTVYNDNNYDRIQSNLVDFASLALYLIGFDQVKPLFPILDYMFSTRFFSLFLGLIISMIVAILSILSIILIYSLLMLNVENRTNEMAILRMLGMKKKGLIQLILFQAIISYALPAILVGLLLGQLSYLGISQLISHLMQLELSPLLLPKACSIASAIGLLIPIIASILPIRSAFSSNIHDALDTQRPKHGIKFKLQRSGKDEQLNWNSVFVGLCITVIGFIFYYFFPLSLVTYNANLLLYLFVGVLLCMLFGLSVLSQNLQGQCEYWMSLFLVWEVVSVRNLVRKNLIAHRSRNSKTSLLFSISIAFIIFFAISFALSIQSFEFGICRGAGGRLNILAQGNPFQFYHPEFSIPLQKLLNSYPFVKGLNYVSYSLDELLSAFGTDINVQMSTLGRYKSFPIQLQAISPQLYQHSWNEFLIVQDSWKGKNNLDEQVYTAEGTNRAIISTFFQETFNLYKNWNQPFLLETTIPTNQYPIWRSVLLKPLAYLSSAPVTFFSKFQKLPFGGDYFQNAVVSLPTFARLLSKFEGRPTTASVMQVPIERAILSLDSSATEEQISDLKSDLKVMGLSIVDVQGQLKPMEEAVKVMNFFFLFTTCIACLLCLFSLMSSMISNVKEHAKEVAVLRAIGIRKFTIVRIFMYEAFLLLLVAAIQGLCNGAVLAYTMSAQTELFTQLPIHVTFPWQIMLLVLALSFVLALLSSYLPLRTILHEPIVKTLRGM